MAYVRLFEKTVVLHVFANFSFQVSGGLKRKIIKTIGWNKTGACVIFIYYLTIFFLFFAVSSMSMEKPMNSTVFPIIEH